MLGTASHPGDIHSTIDVLSRMHQGSSIDDFVLEGFEKTISKSGMNEDIAFLRASNRGKMSYGSTLGKTYFSDTGTVPDLVEPDN